MKINLIFFLVIIASCTNNSLLIHRTVPIENQISNGRLGLISIGKNIDSALNELSKKYSIKLDSIPECEGCQGFTKIFYVKDQQTGQLQFTFEPGWENTNQNKVFRIRVLNEIYETNNGIGVGMRVSDVKKQYTIENINIEGETGIHLIIKELNGSFGLDIPQSGDYWNYTKENLPDTLKINEIIII